jgi:hypothetical protein
MCGMRHMPRAAQQDSPHQHFTTTHYWLAATRDDHSHDRCLADYAYAQQLCCWESSVVSSVGVGVFCFLFEVRVFVTQKPPVFSHSDPPPPSHAFAFTFESFIYYYSHSTSVLLFNKKSKEYNPRVLE